MSSEALKSCPVCGGAAERVDIPAENECDPHAGSSFIRCTRCDVSTALHFDRKENLVSSWNDRARDPDVTELLAAVKHASEVYDAIWVKMSDGEMALVKTAWERMETAVQKIEEP